MTDNPFEDLYRVADELANMTWGQFLWLCACLGALVLFDAWLDSAIPNPPPTSEHEME